MATTALRFHGGSPSFRHSRGLGVIGGLGQPLAPAGTPVRFAIYVVVWSALAPLLLACSASCPSYQINFQSQTCALMSAATILTWAIAATALVLLAAPLTRNRIVHHRSVLLAALVVAAQVYVVAGALPRHPHSDGDDDRPLFDTTPWAGIRSSVTVAVLVTAPVPCSGYQRMFRMLNVASLAVTALGQGAKALLAGMQDATYWAACKFPSPVEVGVVTAVVCFLFQAVACIVWEPSAWMDLVYSKSASRALAALWSCDGGWEASALPVLSGAAALSLQVTLILGALVRGGLVPSPLSHVVTATALLTIALTRILYRIQLRVQSRVLGDVVGDPDAAEALVLSAKTPRGRKVAADPLSSQRGAPEALSMGHWSGEGGREGASPLPTDSKGRRGRGLSYWATRLGLPGHVNTTVPSPINLSTTGPSITNPDPFKLISCADDLPFFRERPAMGFLFTDIVGYTSMVSTWDARRVLVLLHNYFTRVDAAVHALKLFKYETVGDAYVAVAGLNDADAPDFCDRALACAVAMVEIAETIPLPGEGPGERSGIRIRAGLHVGPACAGLLGHTKRGMTLVGDTVNTASRMESTSRPMHIRVTAAFHARLREEAIADLFSPEEVDVKGKGPTATYIVDGTHPALRAWAASLVRSPHAGPAMLSSLTPPTASLDPAPTRESRTSAPAPHAPRSPGAQSSDAEGQRRRTRWTEGSVSGDDRAGERRRDSIGGEGANGHGGLLGRTAPLPAAASRPAMETVASGEMLVLPRPSRSLG